MSAMNVRIFKAILFLTGLYIASYLLTFTVIYNEGYPLNERLELAFDIFLGPMGLVIYSVLDAEYTSSLFWIIVLTIIFWIVKRLFYKNKRVFLWVSSIVWLGLGAFSVLVFIS
ncbi:hypothetical protein A3195_19960 [Candidatus Thiodiazotropha endoloripes]|uniref:hypothetical protein n=1 Tax=Candidatus Thiodiazotropha endoloripes TaxID=1818881 RepID=UPI00083DA1BC|nr:hypothetical protein [Candidatus Thiodiazotropha endoloripes]ODB89448.1 hypothetical protein A3195_19960 [Candidatus Thiodiazotropha endoloripes]ODB89450.1 hypothetical protein A3193_19920 [Candidatus Thiodiazotropha endoloripes]